MDDVVRMLKESRLNVKGGEPIGAAEKSDFLSSIPFGRAQVEAFAGRPHPNGVSFDNFYDAASRALVLMNAVAGSTNTTVNVCGIKNISAEQSRKFISEATPTDLMGTTAIQLAAERILGAKIP
jgi:hypothetical protein